MLDLRKHLRNGAACWHCRKAANIQRAQLEAQKHRFQRQATIGSRHTNIRWVVASYICSLCPHNNGHNQRQSINGVNGKHQHRTLSGLLTALGWIKD